jgi:hypothetical protein
LHVLQGVFSEQELGLLWSFWQVGQAKWQSPVAWPICLQEWQYSVVQVLARWPFVPQFEQMGLPM